MNNGENSVYELIGKDYDYIITNDKNNLSVKIVIPTYCQAKCPFCFNYLTEDTQRHDYIMFLDNLDKSLKLITNNIKDRGITLNTRPYLIPF